jgi:glycosyltransferase involved in cell wall biosynthesis
VYGDVNLNVVDGSAIWAAATVEALALAGCDVTLLLKARVRSTALLEPIERLHNVTIVRALEQGLHEGPAGDVMDADAAIGVLRRLDEAAPFDFVVLRGLQVVRRAIQDGSCDGRLWTYLTDIPQSVPAMTPKIAEELGRIAEASQVMLCQTEEMRSFLESSVPETNGKAVLFPPILPDGTHDRPREPLINRPLRVAYSGKFAPLWKTEEMTRLPAALAARRIPIELHMVGDKIHHVAADPAYSRRMEEALRSTPGVVWHEGRARRDAVDRVARCDVGISWRDVSLDASLELSTKVLEYGAVGLPVVLNRTPMHEALLGEDYPLFANSEAEVVDQLALAAVDTETRELAAQRAGSAAEGFTLDRAVQGIRRTLRRLFPPGSDRLPGERRLRVVVASHDFKFFSRLLEQLQRLPQLEVRVDRWKTVVNHDEAVSQEMADWADVVICEWFGPNVLWYSEHKRAGQRLIARLHRFELYGAWPAQADISRIDKVVCVSPYYGTATRERTGWPDDRITVIPNWVDDEQLDRPKLPGARFHVGMIGVGESRKRVDLALDVLDEVRRHDERFRLFAKTKMPWDYPWIWRRAGEPEATDAYLRRIQTSDRLRGAVVFDRFGPDTGTWLRRVGFLLSTSDDESFHLAPAEGMASGAVPVIRDWPGAAEIYDGRWVHATPSAMAAAILEQSAEGPWEETRRLAQAQVRAQYGLERVVTDWVALLSGDPADRAVAPRVGASGADGVEEGAASGR